MAKKNENLKEEVENGKFLTYEDVERERKRIARERLNTFLRVVGLVTTVLMIVAGLFDILFELSYFGKFASFVSGKGEHAFIWEQLTREFPGAVKIFDDGIHMGEWFPKTVITLVFTAGVVGVVYLVTFSFVDFVEFIKNMIKSSKEIANESAKNVKSSFEGITFRKKKKVDETDDEEESILNTPPKKKKRRTTKNEYGYSDEELDKLLRGEKIEAQKELEEAENKTKALFTDEE